MINCAKRRVCPGAAAGQPGGHVEEPRRHRGVLLPSVLSLNLLLAADFGEAQGIGERVHIKHTEWLRSCGVMGFAFFYYRGN